MQKGQRSSSMYSPFIKTKTQQNQKKSKQKQKKSQQLGFDLMYLYCFDWFCFSINMLFCFFFENGHLSFDMYDSKKTVLLRMGHDEFSENHISEKSISI